jgi:ligand-binding sensor domain-containing protein
LFNLCIILIILFFSITQIYLSQTETYQFIHLSFEEGLSQSSALAIEQDNLGQVWIGTRNGLNKFDGNKITIYKNEADNEESLSRNHILSIKQDRDGFIWKGTTDGINRFDPKTKVFKRYYHGGDKVLLNNNIWEIKEISNGEIWIATSHGLFVHNNEADSFQGFRVSSDLNSALY